MKGGKARTSRDKKIGKVFLQWEKEEIGLQQEGLCYEKNLLETWLVESTDIITYGCLGWTS